MLQLQALFENAALTDFRSRIQLTINTLFASPVDTAFGSIGRLPASAAVLRGSYQRQGATAVYVFEQNATTVFTLKSNVLQAVALIRVVFNTLSNGDDGIVRSRFLMWGTFEFAILERAPASFRPICCRSARTRAIRSTGRRKACASPVSTCR